MKNLRENESLNTKSVPTLHMHCDPDFWHTEGYHPVLDLPDEGTLYNPTDACHVSRNKAKNIKTMKSIYILSVHLTETDLKNFT